MGPTLITNMYCSYYNFHTLYKNNSEILFLPIICCQGVVLTAAALLTETHYELQTVWCDITICKTLSLLLNVRLGFLCAEERLMMVSQASGRMAAQHISVAVLLVRLLALWLYGLNLSFTDENASSIIQTYCWACITVKIHWMSTHTNTILNHIKSKQC